MAAYTPCAVTDSGGCPKNPSWKITAVKVVYRPDRQRIYYTGARFNLFGFATIPLPKLSNPVGDGADSGILSPEIRYSRTNGFEVAVPYYFRLAPNRGLTVTPHVYTSVAPMAQAQYEALTSKGGLQSHRLCDGVAEGRFPFHHADDEQECVSRLFRWRRAVPARSQLVGVGIAATDHRPHVPAPLRHFGRRPVALDRQRRAD